jgi:hypothetical protein
MQVVIGKIRENPVIPSFVAAMSFGLSARNQAGPAMP